MTKHTAFFIGEFKKRRTPRGKRAAGEKPGLTIIFIHINTPNVFAQNKIDILGKRAFVTLCLDTDALKYVCIYRNADFFFKRFHYSHHLKSIIG